MLTTFETLLLEVAIRAGYEPQDATSPASVRQAIQDYLIFDVLSGNQRVVDLPDELKAELPSDTKPGLCASDYIKGRLDLSHYDLGSPALETLRQYLLEGNYSALNKALEESPELVDRRCENGRTLLHEAIIFESVDRRDMIWLLLHHGATLDKKDPTKLDAMDLAEQHGCFPWLDSAFYKYQSQFEALKAVITRRGSDPVDCMALYQNRSFHQPCTERQKSDLIVLLAKHTKNYNLMEEIGSSCQQSLTREAFDLYCRAKNKANKNKVLWLVVDKSVLSNTSGLKLEEACSDKKHFTVENSFNFFNIFSSRANNPNRDVGNANFSENGREDPGL